MPEEKDKKIVVFYHAHCTDGFGGAWVAWKKFGDTAQYIPAFHDQDVSMFAGKEIYMIDMVCDSTETIEQLKRDNIRVTAIDHHISSRERALSTQEPLFDNDHSGCVLAWKYFFPDMPVPKLLLAIEDIDLWKHQVEDSQFLYEFLNLYDFDFTVWSQLVEDFEDSLKRKDMVEKGKLLTDFQRKMIERNIVDNAKLVSFEGHTVYAINAANFVSDMGNTLATMKPPFAIMWREKNDGSVRVSLRGVGDVDCSKIAVKYGGGGHKLAAAFRLNSIADIPWKGV